MIDTVLVRVFWSLEDNTRQRVLTTLCSFFSLQGIPRTVYSYSDNDPTFQGEVVHVEVVGLD